MKIKITSKHGRRVDFEGKCKEFNVFKDPTFGNCVNVTYFDKDIKLDKVCGEDMRITGLIVPMEDGTKITIIDRFDY